MFGVSKDSFKFNPNISELPNELVQNILNRAGFKATQNAAKAKIKSRYAIENIFKNFIIVIKPQLNWTQEVIDEYDKKGENYLQIHKYDEIMRLFHHFGKHVKRIHVYYYHMNDSVRHNINENIIKKCANQLTELAIFTTWIPVPISNQIWEEIQNENGEIRFPKVKKFKFDGFISRNPFDVNSIFPTLETFKLHGDVVDINCLASVTQLKELSLNADESLEEDQLVNIIANNKELTKLTVWAYSTTRTVRAIARNLKNLKTLIVKFVTNEFFDPEPDEVYNLTSVTNLIVIGHMENLYGNISFVVPNLINLKLDGWIIDHRITNFINRFKKLKTVYISGSTTDNAIDCIAPLVHIEEFATINFENSKLRTLKAFFENFNTTVKLNTIKLFHFNVSEFSLYEETMDEINNHLIKLKKPTWKVFYGTLNDKSIEVDQETSINYYLVFKRNPQTQEQKSS